MFEVYPSHSYGKGCFWRFLPNGQFEIWQGSGHRAPRQISFSWRYKDGELQFHDTNNQWTTFGDVAFNETYHRYINGLILAEET